MGFTASDIAESFDKRKERRKKELEEWVVDNPQWWAVGLATIGATSMDFTGTFVDVLRLGEGAAEGSAGGYATDALRLITILGPLARAGGMLGRFLAPLAASGRLRLAVRIKGITGPCTFQAVNNAAAISGGKSIFLTLKEIAAARGVNLSTLAKIDGKYPIAAFIDRLVPYLRQAGLRIKEVKGLKNISDIVNLASKERSPVIFAIRTMVRKADGTLMEIKHSVIAMRDMSGNVRFADYGGKFIESLEVLVSRWGTPTQPITLYQSGLSAAILDGATLTGEFALKLAGGAVLILQGLEAIETFEEGIEFAIPIEPVATAVAEADDPTPAAVVVGSYESFESRKAGKPVIRLPPLYITAGKGVAPPAEYLTGVQFRLNALGFGAGKADGIMGPRTRKAVLDFQRTYPPLRVDGIPGPLTQARLAEVCGY